MKNIFMLFCLGLTLNGYEIYDFYSCKKTGEFKFNVRKFQEDKITHREDFILRVMNIEDGRLIQIEKNGKMNIEIVVGIGDAPVLGYRYINNKKMEIIQENLKKRDEKKLRSEKKATIKINGKKYDVTIYTYKEEVQNSLVKEDLLLITNTETIYEIYKDNDGLPVKIVETKVIIDKTKKIQEPQKIIKEKKRTFKEILEIE